MITEGSRLGRPLRARAMRGASNQRSTDSGDEAGLTMPTTDDLLAAGPSGITPLAAIELQDHLSTIGNDLDRLQGLLADACGVLLASFQGAHAQLSELPGGAGAPAVHAAPAIAAAQQHLGNAVVALQFQDIAAQLIDHSHRRLRSCADQLARQTMPDDDDGVAVIEEAPLRPNPVTQDEMDAGSVELF